MDPFLDHLWAITSIHFQNTPFHPSPGKRKAHKKPLPISPLVWVVTPRPQGGTHLSLGLPFPTFHLKKKKRNLHNSSSLLFNEQPVHQEFGTTLKCFRSSEAHCWKLRWVTLECVWKEEGLVTPPPPLALASLADFSWASTEPTCYFLIYKKDATWRGFEFKPSPLLGCVTLASWFAGNTSFWVKWVNWRESYCIDRVHLAGNSLLFPARIFNFIHPSIHPPNSSCTLKEKDKQTGYDGKRL